MCCKSESLINFSIVLLQIEPDGEATGFLNWFRSFSHLSDVQVLIKPSFHSNAENSTHASDATQALAWREKKNAINASTVLLSYWYQLAFLA